MPVHPGLSPTWAETPKTCFLASGLNNDLFVHICVNAGTDQLHGNHTARAANQHFCVRIMGSIPLWILRVGTFSLKALYKGYSVAASCEGRVHPFDNVRTRFRIEVFQKSNYLNIMQTTPIKAHSVVSSMYVSTYS